MHGLDPDRAVPYQLGQYPLAQPARQPGDQVLAPPAPARDVAERLVQHGVRRMRDAQRYHPLVHHVDLLRQRQVEQHCAGQREVEARVAPGHPPGRVQPEEHQLVGQSWVVHDPTVPRSRYHGQPPRRGS